MTVLFVQPTIDELNTVKTHAIDIYAADMHHYGEFSQIERAKQRATEEVEQLLTHEINVNDHYFFNIIDEATQSLHGYLWYLLRRRQDNQINDAFLAYILVEPQLRRQGVGQQAMQFYEDQAATLGAKRLVFYVFSENQAAMSFYRKLGYHVVEETSFNEAAFSHSKTRSFMLKNLDGE